MIQSQFKGFGGLESSVRWFDTDGGRGAPRSGVATAASVCAFLVATRAFALGGYNPDIEAQRQEQQAEEDESRLRGEAIKRDIPGAEVSTDIPSFWITPAIQFRFPYQPLGIGLSLDALPAPWLRVSGLYSFGMTLGKDHGYASSYAEALIGVRIYSTVSESRVDIPRTDKPSFLNPPVIKIFIPAYHGVFVEAGAITALTALERCLHCGSDIAQTTDVQQVLIPVAGVRYVYAYDIESKRANLRRRMLLQLYGQVMVTPFFATKEARYFPNGASAGPPGIGGRVGIDIPPFGGCLARWLFGTGCGNGNVALGYAPYPRFFIFELQIGFPIY